MSVVLYEESPAIHEFPAKLAWIYYPQRRTPNFRKELYYKKIGQVFSLMNKTPIEKEDILQAKKLLHDAIALDPENGLSYFYLAELYQHHQLPLEESEVLTHEEIIRTLIEQGSSVLQPCDLESYKKHKIRMNAMNYCNQAMLMVVDSYMSYAHYQFAFHLLEKAIALDANYAEAHHLMGWFYLQGYLGRKDPKKAYDCFARAADLGLAISYEFQAQAMEQMSHQDFGQSPEVFMRAIQSTISKAVSEKCVPAQVHLLKYHEPETVRIEIFKKMVDEMQRAHEDLQALNKREPEHEADLSDELCKELHEIKRKRLTQQSLESCYACLELIKYYNKKMPKIGRFSLFTSEATKTLQKECVDNIKLYGDILIRIMKSGIVPDFYRFNEVELCRYFNAIIDPASDFFSEESCMRWVRTKKSESPFMVSAIEASSAKNGDFLASQLHARCSTNLILKAYLYSQMAAFYSLYEPEEFIECDSFFTDDLRFTSEKNRKIIQFYYLIYRSNICKYKLQIFESELIQLNDELKQFPQRQDLLQRRELLEREIIDYKEHLEIINTEMLGFYKADIKLMLYCCIVYNKHILCKDVEQFNFRNEALPLFIRTLQRTDANCLVETEQMLYLQNMLIQDTTQDETLNQLRVELALYYIRSHNPIRALALLATISEVSGLSSAQTLEIAMFYQMCAMDLIHKGDSSYTGPNVFDLEKGIIIESTQDELDVLYCLRRAMRFEHVGFSHDMLVKTIMQHLLMYKKFDDSLTEEEVVKMASCLFEYQEMEDKHKVEVQVQGLDETEALDDESALGKKNKSEAHSTVPFTHMLLREEQFRQEIIVKLISQHDVENLALVFYYYPNNVLEKLGWVKRHSLGLIQFTHSEEEQHLCDSEMKKRHEGSDFSIDSTHQSTRHPLGNLLSQLASDDAWLSHPSEHQQLLIEVCRINCQHIPEANIIFARYVIKFIENNKQVSDIKTALNYIRQLYFHNLEPWMHLKLAAFYFRIIKENQTSLKDIFPDECRALLQQQPDLHDSEILEKLNDILFKKMQVHFNLCQEMESEIAYTKIEKTLYSLQIAKNKKAIVLQDQPEILFLADEQPMASGSVKYCVKAILEEINALKKGRLSQADILSLLVRLGHPLSEAQSVSDLTTLAITLLQNKAQKMLEFLSFRLNFKCYEELFRINPDVMMTILINQFIEGEEIKSELALKLTILKSKYPDASAMTLLYYYSIEVGRKKLLIQYSVDPVFKYIVDLVSSTDCDLSDKHAKLLAEETLSCFSLAYDLPNRAHVIQAILCGFKYILKKQTILPGVSLEESISGIKPEQLAINQVAEIIFNFVQFREEPDILKAIFSHLVHPSLRSSQNLIEDFNRLFLKPFLSNIQLRLQEEMEVKLLIDELGEQNFAKISELIAQFYPSSKLSIH